MPPNQGLVHPKQYDIRDSNVELIGTSVDHKVKYASAASEPAWNDGAVGTRAGLRIWRIEEFQVVPWPEARQGEFLDGDSFIVLHSWRAGSTDNRLGHDIFFWLGRHTTQDEAGTAAYKTVELDEFLGGAATQHREVQDAMSDEFLALFPRLCIRSGGVRSGFRHVEAREEQPARTTMLRVFQSDAGGSMLVHEVEPHVDSLDDGDVFVVDARDKIWVWQGRRCSPMEKARAAQVVHDMTLAKHVEVEVVAQAEARSRRVLELLGGQEAAAAAAAAASASSSSSPIADRGFSQRRPVATAPTTTAPARVEARKLFRLSDASGQLAFDLVRHGRDISRADLDASDVFVLDDAGRAVWVWQGARASRQEKARWLSVAQAYVRQLSGESDHDAHLVPLAKVNDGHESTAFWRAIEAN